MQILHIFEMFEVHVSSASRLALKCIKSEDAQSTSHLNRCIHLMTRETGPVARYFADVHWEVDEPLIKSLCAENIPYVALLMLRLFEENKGGLNCCHLFLRNFVVELCEILVYIERPIFLH